jgi:hypothetical protein
MTLRPAVPAMLAAWMLATPAFAQTGLPTTAQLLQKGIYAQQTSGDLDGAIQTFRQILSSAPERSLAAQTQLHLAQALLQKGDLNGAALEFQTLAANYSEFKNQIAAMSVRMHDMQYIQSITKGTFENGRYHHNATGVEFTVPQGWTLEGDTDSSGDGEIVIMKDSKTGAQGKVWLKPNPLLGSPEGSLQGSLKAKPKQRGGDWKVRPESVHMGTLGGQPSLEAVADFDGGKSNELLLWVRSAKNQVFFFGDAPAEKFSEFQADFQQVIATAYVP